MAIKPEFEKAAETPQKKAERLKAQAKALDDMLRKPPTPQRHLRPTGQLRRDGDTLARQTLTQKRVDISKQLEEIKANMKEKEPRDKSRGLER